MATGMTKNTTQSQRLESILLAENREATGGLPQLSERTVESYAESGAIALQPLIRGIKKIIAGQSKLEGLGPKLMDAFARKRMDALSGVLYSATLHAAAAGWESVEKDEELAEKLQAEMSYPLPYPFPIEKFVLAEDKKPLTPQEAVKWFRRKVPLPKQTFYELAAATKAHAFTIAGFTSQRLLLDVHNSIEKALEEGQSYSEWKKGVGDVFAASGFTRDDNHHISLVFNQAMLSSYNVQRWNHQQDAINERPFGQYLSVADEHVRDEHKALHGKIFRLDDPIWQKIYPPNGFRCRCYVITLRKKHLDELGLKVSSTKGVAKYVDPAFRYNPAFGPTAKQMQEIYDAGEITEILGYKKYNLKPSLQIAFPRPDVPKAPKRLRKEKSGMTNDKIADIYLKDYRSVLGLKGGNDSVVIKDFQGNGLTFSDEQFYHVTGNPDHKKGHWPQLDRGRYTILTKDALKEPEEIWLSIHKKDKGESLRKYYIKTYVDQSGRNNVVVVALDSSTAFPVKTYFPTLRDPQLVQIRSGVLLYLNPKVKGGKK